MLELMQLELLLKNRSENLGGRIIDLKLEFTQVLGHGIFLNKSKKPVHKVTNLSIGRLRIREKKCKKGHFYVTRNQTQQIIPYIMLLPFDLK